MKRILRLGFTATVLLGCLHAQQQFTPYPTSNIQFSSPPPEAPTSITATYLGGAGSDTFHYWVIAHHTRGQSPLTGPATVRRGLPATATNTTNLVWAAVPGAVSYTLLTTTALAVPAPCICALVIQQTATSFTDTGTALLGFTTAPVPTATAVMRLENSALPTTRFTFGGVPFGSPTISPPTLYNADGTAAAPVWSWTADPNNGPFRIGVDNYAFSVGGVSLLELAAGAATVAGTLSATPGGTVPSCALSTITAADLTTASLTEDETLFTLPARGKLTAVSIKHSIAFSGGALLDLTVSIGDSSSTTFYTAAFDIFQAAADTTFQDTDLFKSSTYAVRDVLARFTSTTQQMNGITAGSVDVVTCWVALP